jgi:hypothetical protein
MLLSKLTALTALVALKATKAAKARLAVFLMRRTSWDILGEVADRLVLR